MKIGIYNRAWATAGGGENYAGNVAQLLSSRYEVDLISIEEIDWHKVENRLGLDLSRCNKVLWPKHSCEELSPRTASYDLFINCAYESALRPYSKTSALICSFPHAIPVEHDLDMKKLIFARKPSTIPGYIGTEDSIDALKSYSKIIANSNFTKGWISKRWGIDSTTVWPCIDDAFYLKDERIPREKIILSVGRFFAGGHNKKHDEMILAFTRLQQEGILSMEWKLILAGGLHDEDAHHRAYYAKLQSMAVGHPISIIPNIPFSELVALYKKAAIYWHWAGWGEDPQLHPERLEHFGITTCEALASGCVPVLYDSSSQREILASCKVGYLFESYDTLSRIMSEIDGAFPDSLNLDGKVAQMNNSIFSKVQFEIRLTSALSGLLR